MPNLAMICEEKTQKIIDLEGRLRRMSELGGELLFADCDVYNVRAEMASLLPFSQGKY